MTTPYTLLEREAEQQVEDPEDPEIGSLVERITYNEMDDRCLRLYTMTDHIDDIPDSVKSSISPPYTISEHPKDPYKDSSNIVHCADEVIQPQDIPTADIDGYILTDDQQNKIDKIKDAYRNARLNPDNQDPEYKVEKRFKNGELYQLVIPVGSDYSCDIHLAYISQMMDIADNIGINPHEMRTADLIHEGSPSNSRADIKDIKLDEENEEENEDEEKEQEIKRIIYKSCIIGVLIGLAVAFLIFAV